MAKQCLNDLSFPYINERGNLVSGTAATLHAIKMVGGLGNYNRIVGHAHVNALLDSLSPAINATIEVEIKRKQLRLVK